MVEGIIALALASMVLVAVVTYFGFTLRGFAQQEDTLTGSRDAQLILSYLRADINAADGYDSSATATTGTTFPKSQMLLFQTLGQSTLQPYIHTRGDEPRVLPGEDPILDPMSESVRTAMWIKLLELAGDIPIHDYLPPGLPTNRMLRSLNYGMNAVTWSRPPEDDKDRLFVLNVREGPLTHSVSYAYSPKKHSLVRRDPTGATLLARDTLESFSASPYYELLLIPPPPGPPAEIIKMWVELSFTLKAPEDGSRIAKRPLTFTTRILPRYLNMVLKTRWGL